MIGSRKYNTLANYCYKTAQAKAVAVVVLEGSKGCGFAKQGSLQMMVKLPAALRLVAQAIEDDIYGQAQKH
jgi:hypothetical protein